MTDIQYCENCQGSGHIIAPMEDFLVKAHPCMVCTGTGVTDLQPSDQDTKSRPSKAQSEATRKEWQNHGE